MAESFTAFGRIDNSAAGNASVNVKPGDAVQLTFQADGDLDGVIDSQDNVAGGDLKIDADGLGGIDGNTTVSIDGGVTFQTFTFVLVGNFPSKNNTPPAIAGQEILLIELADGTRTFFFTDPNLQDEATANSVPQGAASIANVDTTPQGVVCFTAGTTIATPDGPKLIETIKVGDLIQTLDNGNRRVRWIGSSSFTAAQLEANPKLNPIRIAVDALGPGFPATELAVSPQHRILVRSKIAVRMFESDEVLIPAKHLLELDGIESFTPSEGVSYYHILLDQHEIVWANGALAETLLPGPEAVKTLSDEAREEIETIFPNLSSDISDALARPSPKGKLSRKLATRHAKNGQPLQFQ